MIRTYTFRIKRYNPERDTPDMPATQRRVDTFTLELDGSERVLDGLVKIKDTMDGTLTFRRSCAHGVCGSCAMMLNGMNSLACQTLMKDMDQTLEVEALPALPVVKDLVVDMRPFFALNEAVMPYLINNDPPPERERYQSPEDQHKVLQATTCIMCSCCTNACPSFWADSRYLGPSALLKAYRFIFDSRDQASAERIEKIVGANGLWRCHSIFNCVEVCPKEIDITAHLSQLKRVALKGKR